MRLSFDIKSHWPWLLAAGVPLVLFLGFYPDYLRNNTFFWVCIVTLPLSMQATGQNSLNFFGLAIAMGVLTLVLPTTIGIYCVMCLLLIFLMQSIVGRLHFTLLIHALLASPLFSYFSSLVSFPIRLQLSKIVSGLLNMVGYQVTIEGNLVHFGNSSFLVDEACAGMFMLGYGLLFGTLILSHFSKNRQLRIKQLVTYYLLLIGLILSGNIIRITLLIVFEVMPDHWFHEGLGLIVYVGQILVPFYLIVKCTIRKTPVSYMPRTDLKPIFPVKKYAILCVMMLLLIGRHQFSMASEIIEPQEIHLSGYDASVVKSGVTKLQNDHALIYIKPPVAAYQADHNPMICWQGSGYHFKKIEKHPVQGLNLNSAELVKGDEKVYTAWWFQSTAHKTGDQLTWRKHALQNNEQFYLINLTCNSKAELERQINIVLDQNILSTNNNI